MQCENCESSIVMSHMTVTTWQYMLYVELAVEHWTGKIWKMFKLLKFFYLWAVIYAVLH